MISHKYKCIFIHISKCAGTSVEKAFGINTSKYHGEESESLFGWDNKNHLWLQHATPQQLFDFKLVEPDHWNTYYKFIIYRNSWSRAYSDFLWMKNTHNINDSFSNFLNKKGRFFQRLNNNSTSGYSGDHLNLQKDYFFLNGRRISYHQEIDFKNLPHGFSKVIKDLKLEKNFFNYQANRSPGKKLSHYSFFYDEQKKRLVDKLYKPDIEFFNFEYEEKKKRFFNLNTIFGKGGFRLTNSGENF